MSPIGIAGGRNPAFAQGVASSHHANETIPKQGLRTNLRPDRFPDHSRFQIDHPIAQRCTVFVRLEHETQPHAGSFLIDTGDQTRTEVFHKAFASPQREGSSEQFEIECLRGAKHGFRILHQLTNLLPDFDGPGCRDETPACPYQQRIPCCFTKPRQRSTHR